ncbi:uncharacterized protein LOC112599236 [Melanaphis sacchari]|uniref:uncharacterized protein LOC112599236 n=1 Tax=Melanaphis sacchari TaxID=742174 RepID=UPI000DC1358B|nr:uncharacterized protein LOC112599236 [Melanaphis sacchari]
MILQVIILTITLLFSQGKCGTYIPEKYTVEHNPNLRQTYQATYNPIEQQPRIVYVDKDQYPKGWNENIIKDDRSPIIFTDKAPITINYNGNSGQSLYGFRNSYPTVLTSQNKIKVNYDGLHDDDIPPSNQNICLFLSKTMVELPSGIVMPYLKFKTISPYLSEDQKSDIRIILDNKNMAYEKFQETLRYYGCDNLEDSQQQSEVNLTNYVTLANGTQVEMNEYRNIVSSITSGSETLMVPNVVNGKYSLYRSLIADELPELIPSAFVITHAGIVVPFSLYYAVDTEYFQRPPAAVELRIRQIKWRDGKLVDVQTIRNVIDALKTPTIISFVFPNKKRVPFVQCNVKESTELYEYDPEKVVVDVGQCKSIILSHFNDILFAMRIPDDRGDGKYKRFNPPVFAWDPKCINKINISNITNTMNPQNNNCTELTNITTNLNTSGKTNNMTIENENNATKTPICTEKYTKDEQNNYCSPVIEGNEIPIIKNTEKNQTEIKNITLITQTVAENKKFEPNNTKNNTVTTETKNSTTPNPKINQNSSNPTIESNNTLPIIKDDYNQTETKNLTIINNTPIITNNITGANNTNVYEKYEPIQIDNDTGTMEIRDITDLNQTAVLTENSQNGSNPVIKTNEIAEITNTDDYQNPTETVNTTESTPNHTKNMDAPNSSRIDDSTYTGSNETPNVINTAETIQTPEAAITSDADDIGPTENPDTISETNTATDDDKLADVYNITTTGMAEPTQPTPIYTETIKTPNNGSVTNNATKIVNIVVY